MGNGDDLPLVGSAYKCGLNSIDSNSCFRSLINLDISQSAFKFKRCQNVARKILFLKHLPLWKLEESESDQIVSVKVKLTYFDEYLSLTM